MRLIDADALDAEMYHKSFEVDDGREERRMTRLIDADALAKFIDYGHLNNPNEKLYSENDIREMIDMMPTKDAVPVRHGRWVWNDYGGFGNCHCSECGNICICNGDYDYCPNCGARMDKDETD